MDDIGLVDRFKLHQMDERATARAHAIRADCLRIAQKINESAKDSREKSNAITKLEEAAMWATRAIAMNPEK
jgi:hypothetical protein